MSAPHGIAGATDADLVEARRRCDARQRDGIVKFFHFAAASTDLVMGGGCPGCIQALREIVAVAGVGSR